MCFAVVANTPQFFAGLSSARQVGKIRTFPTASRVHRQLTYRSLLLPSFTANRFTLLDTCLHLLGVQFKITQERNCPQLWSDKKIIAWIRTHKTRLHCRPVFVLF